MPLKDIHLHSNFQRELRPNGNISYIYLIAGANILLLAIVLFNLWLNAGLIFNYNKKYYQLLRLNGASSRSVFFNELFLAVIIGGLSLLLGGFIAYFYSSKLSISYMILTLPEITLITSAFFLLIVFVSLLPVFSNISTTLFLNDKNTSALKRNLFSGIKYMLIVQYSLVMFIVVTGFVINRQVNMIRGSQVGGKDYNILAMKEQPEEVQKRYSILKEELFKYPEIEDVASSF